MKKTEKLEVELMVEDCYNHELKCAFRQIENTLKEGREPVYIPDIIKEAFPEISKILSNKM